MEKEKKERVQISEIITYSHYKRISPFSIMKANLADDQQYQVYVAYGVLLFLLIVLKQSPLLARSVEQDLMREDNWE